MKILVINKFLYPKGGAETYLLALSKLLRQDGHEVIYFSQQNKKNISASTAKYFLPDLDLSGQNKKNILGLGRIFWSFSAQKKLDQLIKTEKPDLVHLHNIYHQISPSILKTIKKHNLPVVMTVHDFKLVKHDYTLRADGQKTRHKNSLAIDLLLKAEMTFHKLLKIYEKNIDLFIAPSEFVKKELLKKGFDEKKIIVVPHFIDLTTYPNSQNTEAGDYILYAGRLDESKGVDLLIKVANRINNNLKLKIAGTGPQEKKLHELVKKLGAEKKVEFLKHLDKQQLINVIKNCRFTVFPSRVHETFGLGILESYACFKPTLASRAGAFTEILQMAKLVYYLK